MNFFDTVTMNKYKVRTFFPLPSNIPKYAFSKLLTSNDLQGAFSLPFKTYAFALQKYRFGTAKA